MKFNDFEKYLMIKGLILVEEQTKNEIREQIAEGGHPIMTEGFTEMTIKEILNKLNFLTIE